MIEQHRGRYSSPQPPMTMLTPVPRGFKVGPVMMQAWVNPGGAPNGWRLHCEVCGEDSTVMRYPRAAAERHAEGH